MNQSWNGKHYINLLKKEDLTIAEQMQLEDYRLQLFLQLCYNGKSDFTSYVSKYLSEKIDPDEFRRSFVWLSGEFLNLVGDIEQHPSELVDYIVDCDHSRPFFDFKKTILSISLTMLEKSDSVMSETDFQTLVARFYYQQLFSEDA